MAQSKENKLAKTLLGEALEGYRCLSEEIEQKLDEALLKFGHREDWHKQTRIYLWSFPKIRAAIYKEAMEVYGEEAK